MDLDGTMCVLHGLFLIVRNGMFVKVVVGFNFFNSRLSADVNVKKDEVED